MSRVPNTLANSKKCNNNKFRDLLIDVSKIYFFDIKSFVEHKRMDSESERATCGSR